MQQSSNNSLPLTMIQRPPSNEEGGVDNLSLGLSLRRSSPSPPQHLQTISNIPSSSRRHESDDGLSPHQQAAAPAVPMIRATGEVSSTSRLLRLPLQLGPVQLPSQPTFPYFLTDTPQASSSMNTISGGNYSSHATVGVEFSASSIATSSIAHNRPSLRRAPPSKKRRNPFQSRGPNKVETIPIPYPWATDRRARILSMDKLKALGIRTVSDEVVCKKCERGCRMDFDLEEKFNEVSHFLMRNMSAMHERAPSEWLHPVLPGCEYCGQEKCVSPVISGSKKSINWLFLLLGQFIGCCTLEQLKYFCKHTENHRTGAKDRVLYLTYLELCKQLDPSGRFSYR